MIKITILEDEDEQAAQLTDFLDRYAAERGDLSFTTVRYSRGIELVLGRLHDYETRVWET